MSKKQKLYQINGASGYIEYIKLNPEGNRECPKMKGYLEDNKGRIFTEDQARQAWLASCIIYGNSFSGNVEGTMGKGFDMNVPWVAKRCDSVNVFTQSA
jgi:hypothetical protein